MFNLIIFGPPGAGKGTQSKRISDRYGYKHISTGDFLRAEIAALSQMGLEAKLYIDQGELVPDPILIKILDHVIERDKDVNGFVWDGFPRTLVQAEAFDKLLEHKGRKVNLVLSLEVEMHELVRRLVNRGIEDGRSDDTEEIILQRQQIYRNMTQPLISYYRNKGKFAAIGGVQPIDKVFEDICSKIEHYND